MKKVLVVEDTPKNMVAAKIFFSKIIDFEFVFVDNVYDAIDRLQQVDALISDRGLPYIKNTEARQTYGFIILGQAKSLGKPAVVITEHGRLGIGKIKDSDSLPDESMELLSRTFENNLLEIPFDELADLGGYIGGVEFFNWYDNILKSEEKSWRMAWEELQQQF